jgi:regulator of sigma E protease
MVTDTLGYEIGFKDGDKIVSVDGKTFKYFDEAKKELLFAKTVEINRNGVPETIHLPEKWIGKLKKTVIEVGCPTIVSKVTKGTGAEKAGLQPKDIIVKIDSVGTPTYISFKKELAKHNKQIVDVSFIRNGAVQTAKVQVSDTGTIGFQATNDMEDFVKLHIFKPDVRKYGFFESFPAGIDLGVKTIKDYWRQLGLIVNFKNGAYKQTGGFASMAKIYGTEWDWLHFWSITAFISIALAIMNLLPIPGLDGGYVVFTLIEMIIGRKVNEKVVEVATTIGLVLLLILMVLVNGNDILKMFK